MLGASPRGSFQTEAEGNITVQQLFQMLSNQNLENSVFLDKALTLVKQMFFDSLAVPLKVKEDYIEEVFQKFEDYFDCQRKLHNDVIDDVLSTLEMIQNGKYGNLILEMKKEIQIAKDTSTVEFLQSSIPNLNDVKDCDGMSEKQSCDSTSFLSGHSQVLNSVNSKIFYGMSQFGSKTDPSEIDKEKVENLSDIHSVSSEGNVPNLADNLKKGVEFKIEKIETGLQGERKTMNLTK